MEFLKKCSFSLAAVLLFCSFTKKPKQPADYVNPFIGATTSIDLAGTYHGLGKTFPGATTPFGMVQVSPNTISGGDINCSPTHLRFPGSRIPGFQEKDYRKGYKRCTQKPEAPQYTCDRLKLNKILDERISLLRLT